MVNVLVRSSPGGTLSLKRLPGRHQTQSFLSWDPWPRRTPLLMSFLFIVTFISLLLRSKAVSIPLAGPSSQNEWLHPPANIAPSYIYRGESTRRAKIPQGCANLGHSQVCWVATMTADCLLELDIAAGELTAEVWADCSCPLLVNAEIDDQRK